MITGLRQKILFATSKDAIETLLEEGKTYEFAAKKTRNSWKSAARRKVQYLTGVKVSVPEVEVVEEDAPKKKRHKKKI
jgi:hypothetical protein